MRLLHGRAFRIGVLGFHALVEGAVAVLMWATPGVFFVEPTPELVALARSFGTGAGAVAVLSALLVRWGRGATLAVGAATLGVYQLGICVAQVLAPMPGVPAWVPPLFHAGFVLAFAGLARQGAREAAG
jgi:hypothetical protein